MPDRNPTDDPDRAADEAASLPPSLPASGIDPVRVTAVLALVAATCWVVSAWASVWLVPPYLVVMALLLCPSPAGAIRRLRRAGQGSPSAGTAALLPGRVDPVGDGAADGGSDVESVADSLSAGSGGIDPAPGSGPATATARPKRARTRTRKAAPKPLLEPVEPVEASWVEVGPGKFVRVETPTAAEPVAGPHLPVGPAPEATPAPGDDPVTLPGAPAPVAEVEPSGLAPGDHSGALPGLDFIFRYHPAAPPAPEPAADPIAEADSRPFGTAAVVPDALELCGIRPMNLAPADAYEAEFDPQPDLDASTADGIAPQVEDCREWAEEAEFPDDAAGTECGSAADATWFESSTEPPEQCRSADLEPSDAWDAAAVDPLEQGFDPDATMAADPEVEDTRDDAAPDEVVYRDWPEVGGPDPGPGGANPGCEIVSEDAADVDADDPDATIPGRPIARSVRLARAIRPGRGDVNRSPGRRTLARVPGRSAREIRRPVDPRRLAGRRVGRPRQITRTSPPRSPPRPRLVE